MKHMMPFQIFEAQSAGPKVGDKVDHKRLGKGQVIGVGADGMLTARFAGNTVITAPAASFAAPQGTPRELDYTPASKDPNPSEVVEWNETDDKITDILEYKLRDKGRDFGEYLLFKNSDHPGVRVDWDGTHVSSVVFVHHIYDDTGARLVGVRCVKLAGGKWHLSFGSILPEEDYLEGALDPAVRDWEQRVYLSRVGFICSGTSGLVAAIRRELPRNEHKITKHPKRVRPDYIGKLSDQLSPEYQRLAKSDPTRIYKSVDTPQVIGRADDINSKETKEIVNHFRVLGLNLTHRVRMPPHMFDSHRLISHHGEKSNVFTMDLATGDMVVVLISKDDDDKWYVNFRAVPPHRDNRPNEQCGFKCDGLDGLLEVISGPLREFIEICVEKSKPTG